jgi:hypothetical protein
MALRLSNPVIGNRKSPIRFGQFISHDHGSIAPIIGECVLERVDYELGDNQTNADRLAGSEGATFDITSKETGWRLSIIETSKVLHKLITILNAIYTHGSQSPFDWARLPGRRLKETSYENSYRLPGATIERLGFHPNAKQRHSRHPAENDAEK